jgi:pSer/pThr/pTyr-binding forkhead associated (FHA) protein
MKLSLIVAEGVHQGKVIPIPGPQFLIGRDPECQLRPSSPAISKRHCGIVVRNGVVFVKDYGSTNGTFVNDEKLEGELEVSDGVNLKVGPLSFTLKIDAPVPKSATPAPAKAAPAKSAPAKAKPVEEDALTRDADESEMSKSERMAALLLGDDDDEDSGKKTSEADIPDGSTVMEMPAVDTAKPDGVKKPEPPKGTKANTSSAADAILKQYMRRPRT